MSLRPNAVPPLPTVWPLTLLLLVALVAVTVWFLFDHVLPPPLPPVAAPSPEVLRRLEIRLHADLDKPGARGDRYRVFECKEVPR
jgi:hypothetical protein